MSDLTRILSTASERVQSCGHQYAGDLTPSEAYTVLTELANAKLIDVRTQPELDFVGLVPGSVLVEWQHYPDMRSNPKFAETLAQRVEEGDYLLFLCRTGVRSAAAATFMAAQGYSHCFNVMEGFEGQKDSEGRRGTIEGWKVAGLPWINS